MTGAITATPTDVARQTGIETDIRPFRVSIPDAELVDLRRRIKATKWPEKETVNDETQGVQFAQMKVIAPLTDPAAHGGKAEDAFDVVIPSFNMAATVPAEISKAMAAGSKPPSTLTPDERNAWDQLDFFYKKGLGYANEMSLRPQTLYAIADSPVGLAAWILDHDARSYSLSARVFDGQPEGLTRHDILDNITMYWLTNTAVSSARLYWDTTQTATSGFSTAGASRSRLP